MPQRREPHLETEAKEVITKGIIRAFKKWIKRINTATILNRLEELEIIRQESIQLREYLSQLPASKQREILPCIINIFPSLVGSLPNIVASLRDTYEIIMKTVLFPSLQVFDLANYQNPLSITIALRSLNLLFNITVLILPETLIGSYYAELMATQIHLIPLLEEFTFAFNCTNGILELLSLHCSKLKVLKIRYSMGVGDVSVSYLLALKNLEFLDVYRCCITEDRYRQILCRLPKLRNICWHNFIDTILSVFLPNSLMSISKADITATTCIHLPYVCPNITELKLSPFRADDVSLLPVGRLNQLRKLEVSGSHFLMSGLDYVIIKIGHNLESLILRRTEDLDIKAIIINCSNISHMSLLHSTFLRLTTHMTYDETLPHFQSLQSLCLNSVHRPGLYYDHVAYYSHLKCFHAINLEAFSDNNVSTIVSNGGFKVLETFNAEHCMGLSQITVEVLVSNCDFLRTLGTLSTWQHIDIDQVRQSIRQQNLDLSLIPSDNDIS